MNMYFCTVFAIRLLFERVGSPKQSNMKISEKTITKDELKKLFDISDQQSEKQTKTKTTTSKKKSRKK